MMWQCRRRGQRSASPIDASVAGQSSTSRHCRIMTNRPPTDGSLFHVKTASDVACWHLASFRTDALNGRFWHLADIPTVAAFVRFWTKADNGGFWPRQIDRGRDASYLAPPA